MIVRDVEVDGRRRDVHIEEGRIVEQGGGVVIDGGGGALLPGLWDHHIHLFALAAALGSVDVSGDLRALRSAPPGPWIRAVGYHESVAGELDRQALDAVVSDRPVRVQHRTGQLWVLNTRGLAEVGIDPSASDGRLYGADSWIRERTSVGPPPDLRPLELERYGVVGVTDMTPYESADELAALANARVPQHVVATGGVALSDATFPAPLQRGPVKLLVADHDLPPVVEIAAAIRRAHGAHRPVAIHCTTRVALVIILAAFDDAGSVAGDRIEHGAVIPPEFRAPLRRHRLTVVTQPGFVHDRGDSYLSDVDEDDVPHLYPCASLLDHGIAVAGSTDAPYGTHDPWRAMTAAVRRRTLVGTPIVPAEAVSGRRALDLFLGSPGDPGGNGRRVTVGAPADLCLLDCTLDEALVDLDARHVAATFVDGDRVF